MTETKDDVAGLVAEPASLVHELRERTAFRFAGDCKCGGCQLVPRALIDKVMAALSTSEARTAQAVAAAYEDAARVAEYHGDTWSGTRCVETCLQESAVDEKVVEIAAAIRARAATTGARP